MQHLREQKSKIDSTIILLALLPSNIPILDEFFLEAMMQFSKWDAVPSKMHCFFKLYVLLILSLFGVSYSIKICV